MAKEEQSKQPLVKVYSAQWCGFCRMVKAYLSSKDVEFQEVDVEANPEAANEIRERTGQAGIPVTIFDDKDVVIGFDRNQIDSYLKEYKLA